MGFTRSLSQLLLDRLPIKDYMALQRKMVAATEKECFEQVRKLLGFLPSSCREMSPSRLGGQR